MANEQAPEQISPEAFARVKQERDDLKAKVQEYEPIIADFGMQDRFYQHFDQAQEPNPYGLARAAVKDVTLKSVEPDQLPERLDSWLTEQRALLGVPTAPVRPTEAPSPAPPTTQFAQVGADPQAGGEPAGVPHSTMSPEYREAVRGKSLNERVDMLKRGEFQSPEEIKNLASGGGVLGRG